jgi:ABC-2 type transport system permease protein
MNAALSAFIGRDWAYQTASKFAIFGQLTGVLVTCAMMYFVGRTFGSSASALKIIKGQYFEFVLVGIVFARFQSVALNSFASAVQRDQASGTIEAILVSRISVPAMVVASAASAFFFTAVQSVLILLIGAAVFGVNLHHANLASSVAALALSMLAISPIGICAAASVIAFKKGTGAVGVVASATNLLGGVYFPVAVLPLPLKIAAMLFPITHGLAALRDAILHGATLSAIASNLAVLAIFAAVGIPLALVLFVLSIQHARRVGTLAYV